MLSFYLALIDSDQNKSKFEKIYNTYHRKMLNIAYVITKNGADAEIALSDALYNIAKAINRIDDSDEKKMKSYLYTIVKNTSRDLLREKASSKEVEFEEAFKLEIEVDIEKIIEGDEKYIRTLKKIYLLPDIYKNVMKLRYLNDLSLKEISEVLNIPLNTVKIQLFRGAKMLREILKEEGVHK